MGMLGTTIWDLKRFGHVHYNHLCVQSIRDFILKAEHWDDEETCYAIAALRDATDDKEYSP